METVNQRFYRKHRAQELASVRSYQLRNPEKVKQSDFLEARRPKARFNMGKHSAKEHNHLWSITFEEYIQEINQGCFYCGKDLSQQTGHSLDRIDNAKGYSSENVLGCCGECNGSRSNRYSVDKWQVMVLAGLIYEDSNGLPKF